MSQHYAVKSAPELGYYHFDVAADGARWLWTEKANGVTYHDEGPWLATLAAAYRAAADDWESNGNSANRRLSGQLRAAATREEKRKP